MGMLLQLGYVTAGELHGIGHVSCTLGGVNYESRGKVGCLRGSAARGASHSLYRHALHVVLSDGEARAAKRYADSCLGQPYVWGGVPSSKHGGDCSGYVSGIICAARGQSPHRLFATGNLGSRAAGLGLKPGLGGGGLPGGDDVGAADRPYPGHAFKQGAPRSAHVEWIQARLNDAAGGSHAVLGGRPLAVDGLFGPSTHKVVVDFQRSHNLRGIGQVGPQTWDLLLAVR